MIVIGGLIHLVIISNKYFTSRLHGQLFRDGRLRRHPEKVRLTQSLSNNKLRLLFGFFNAHMLTRASS